VRAKLEHEGICDVERDERDDGCCQTRRRGEIPPPNRSAREERQQKPRGAEVADIVANPGIVALDDRHHGTECSRGEDDQEKRSRRACLHHTRDRICGILEAEVTR